MSRWGGGAPQNLPLTSAAVLSGSPLLPVLGVAHQLGAVVGRRGVTGAPPNAEGWFGLQFNPGLSPALPTKVGGGASVKHTDDPLVLTVPVSVGGG